MNEILKKRIEEAAGKSSFKYLSKDGIEELELGCHYEAGFMSGAEYALSNQWINAEEALPEYDEAVIVRNYNGEIFFCHRSNRIGVKTDDDKWCNYTDAKIISWMPMPEFEPKK